MAVAISPKVVVYGCTCTLFRKAEAGNFHLERRVTKTCTRVEAFLPLVSDIAWQELKMQEQKVIKAAHNAACAVLSTERALQSTPLASAGTKRTPNELRSLPLHHEELFSRVTTSGEMLKTLTICG